MKSNFADRFAIGIIDKDKTAVDYLNEFSEVCNRGSLTLLKHQTKPHYIIQIFPAIERFILECAQETNVNLSDFDLPSDFEKLKKESKTVNSKFDDRFKRLFKRIKGNGSVDFNLLSAWISYLKEQNYKADLDFLRAM